MEELTTHVLGCKVNFADTQTVAGVLATGHDSPAALVGTCCVTAEGEKQSRKEVRRAARRVGPQGKVYVTGCAARRNPAVFAGLGQNIEVLAGAAEEIAERLAHKMQRGAESASIGGVAPVATPINCDTDATVTGGAVAADSEDHAQSIEKGSRTRYFLKIQDGCANVCSYCVIPSVRGRPRSVPAAHILKSAKSAVEEGYPELVVTGINVGAWRDGEKMLPGLLESLAATAGLKRLRLSSMEINHVTAGLIKVLQEQPAICRHLHLPLQSGDDGVLAAMRRRYSAADFRRRVEAAREALPGINITTDVIVGYPAEDVTAFENTLRFIEETGFSRAHVFVYSSRPGTAAENMGNPVPPAEKKRRGFLARELSDRLQRAHRQRKVGAVSEVLLESSQGPRNLTGYSSDYTRFVVRGGRPGSVVKVLAESVIREGVMGKLVSHE